MKKMVFVVLAALLIFTPLVFSVQSSELFEFPKLLLIYFGASLLFPLLVFRLPKLKQKIINPKTKNIKFFVLGTGLFLLSQLLATFFSIDSHVSFFGYYSRFNGGLLSLFSYLTISISVLFFLNREQVEKLLKIALLAGIFTALWGLPSHFGHDFICLMISGKFNTDCWTSSFVPQLRLFSTLGQPNWFATYLLILIFINFYFFVSGRSLLPKKFRQYSPFLTVLLFLLFTLELIWTNSRSGLLTYLILVPLFFAIMFIKQKAKFKKLLKQTFYLLPAIVLLTISLALWPFLSSRLNSLFVQSQPVITKVQKQTSAPAAELKITPSSQIRLIVWQGAWKLAQQYPLFGTGVETFAYAYNFTRPVEHNLTSEWNYVYNKAHNELLNYLATTGWFGLITYLLMFTAFLAPAVNILFTKKSRADLEPEVKDFALCYLGIMASIFIMNFFGFSTTVTSLFFYLLPAAMLIFLQKLSSSDNYKELSLEQLAVYFVWIMFSFIYLLNYFTADRYYAKAKQYKQVQDFTNAYISGQKALDLRKEPVYLDQQAAVAANLAALQQIQRNNPQAKQFTQEAIDYNNQTLSLSPKNVFYYKTRAKIFYVLSMIYVDQTDQSADYLFKAIQALETASELAPTDPIIPYTHASLIELTEPDKALKLIQRSLMLKPDYNEAKELQKRLQI